MAWTKVTRRQYPRRTARYASDMTDREWLLMEPFLPMPRRLGRPRITDLREVVNALLYIAMTGCQCRMLPKDFPPCSTIQRYLYEWRTLGLWARINHHLVMEARELEGKEASPTAGQAWIGLHPLPQVRSKRIDHRCPRLPGTIGRSLKASLNVFAHRLAVDARFSGNGRHRQPLLMQIQDHDRLLQLDHQNPPSDHRKEYRR